MTCPGCGGPLPPAKPGAGRQRKWCSERCRKAQYAGKCESCGSPTNGHDGKANAPRRCNPCALKLVHEANQRRARARRDRIVELWNQGLLLREIAAELDTTKVVIGVETSKLRKLGLIGYRKRRKVVAP